MHIVYSLRNLISGCISSIIIRSVSFIVSCYSLYMKCCLSCKLAYEATLPYMQSPSKAFWVCYINHYHFCHTIGWFIERYLSWWIIHTFLHCLCLQTLQAEDKVVQKNYINCCPVVKQLSSDDQINISVKWHKLVIPQ